jgi:hypothetical protein
VDISNNIPPENQAANSVLDKNKKIAVAGLSVFALVIMIVWGVSMRNNIYSPLNRGVDKNITSNSTCPNGNCALTEDERMKTRDTDGDGLTDWEEVYNYLTSPYLEDSDSDGLLDGNEIKIGQNPNCPLGQDCNGASVETSVEAEGDSSLTGQDIIEQDSTVTGDQLFLSQDKVEENKAALEKAFTGQADAASLRKLLLDSGADKATLDSMTDEQLMASYAETLKNISTQQIQQ